MTKKPAIRALQDEPPIIIDDGSSLVVRCKGMVVATPKKKWTSPEGFAIAIVAMFPAKGGDPVIRFFQDVDWIKFQLCNKTTQAPLRKLTYGKGQSTGSDLDVDDNSDVDLNQSGIDPLGRNVFRATEVEGQPIAIDAVTIKQKDGLKMKIDVDTKVMRKTEVRLEVLT